MAEFRMPSLGADMEAGTLVAWRCKPGDRLQRGDIIAEVETDKGTIEVDVFSGGIVDSLLVEPGRKVPVGTLLAILREPGTAAEATPTAVTVSAARDEEPRPLRAASVPAAVLPLAEPPAPARAASIASIATVPAPPSARRRARELGVDLAGLPLTGRITLADVERAAAATPTRPPPVPRRRISPAARRRAEQLGLELSDLPGTDPERAITLDDVERAARARSEVQAIPSAQPSQPGATADRQRALRRAIAAAMSRSKREIPHYYLSTTIDLGAAVSWLTTRNAACSMRERVLPGALLLKAVALAAKRMPDFNAYWQEQTRPSEHVHLGVGIALRGGGLVAPAIHDADQLELQVLMDRLQDLVLRARSGSLRSSELSDGTITVTSLGERGVDSVLPIIYPPQTAVVGFGRIAERPWAVSGALAIRPVVIATLAADHRASDGHRGARFLCTIDQLLQEPEKL